MSNINIRVAEEKDLEELKKLSSMWNDEDITFGYGISSIEEIAEYDNWIAEKDDQIIGFLGGNTYSSSKMKSVMSENTMCFEIEEFYVVDEYRSLGVGSILYDYVMNELKKINVSYVTLIAANEDAEKLLNFYKKKDMKIHSTRLFKEL